MNCDYSELERDLEKVAARFHEKGAFLLCHNGRTVLQKYFNEAEQDSGASLNEHSRYLLDLDGGMIVSLAVLMLADRKKLRLGDKISRYLPEVPHGDEITVRQLLSEKSGLRDYFFGEILPKKQEDAAYSALSPEEQRRKELVFANEHVSYSDVLALIGDKPLDNKPGSLASYSLTNRAFLKEILERVYGAPLSVFAENEIFRPLSMTETSLGDTATTERFVRFRNKTLLPVASGDLAAFTTTLGDLEKLMRGVFEHRLFSEKLWKAATRCDSEGSGLYFCENNGYLSFDSEFAHSLGDFWAAYDRERDVMFLLLTTAEPAYVTEGNESTWLHPEIRRVLDGFFLYPKDTKMVPYNRRNWRGAFTLEVRPEQLEFVDPAKDIIAFYAARRSTDKLFVEMEGGRAVGILELTVDPKKDIYDVQYVLIDRRFQRRGFGEVMLRFAVDYLHKAGAKKIEIGVNRYNVAARKLYESVGFRTDHVYEEFCMLSIHFSD